jgi:hypothetical protein
MRYDYIKYPEDRLYLRVGNLLTQLKDIAKENSNIELYAYLSQISKWVKRPVSFDDIDLVISVENHILSTNFLNQSVFKDKDKESMIPVIRQYKLNQLV